MVNGSSWKCNVQRATPDRPGEWACIPVYQAPTYLPDLPAVRLFTRAGPGRVFYQECGFYQLPRIYQGGAGVGRGAAAAAGGGAYLLFAVLQ